MKPLPFLPFFLLLFSCHSSVEQAIGIGTISYETNLDSARTQQAGEI
jgi:hypothetical protein